MIIRPITLNDAPDLAQMHIQGINAGFISSLGIDFVAALYQAIAESKYSFGFIAEDDQKIIGFVAFTSNIHLLYYSVIKKKGIRFFLLLAAKMFSWTRIRKMLETFFYPKRIKKMSLPDAELLSIVVSSEQQGRGLAVLLAKNGLAECRKRGIDKVKVLVFSDNIPANKLYLKCGFEWAGQLNNHGVLSNIYIANTGSKQ